MDNDVTLLLSIGQIFFKGNLILLKMRKRICKIFDEFKFWINVLHNYLRNKNDKIHFNRDDRGTLANKNFAFGEREKYLPSSEP